MTSKGTDLVGVAEIATRARVKADTVQKWRLRHASFPAPDAVLASGPVWMWAFVERWLALGRPSGRATGRWAVTVPAGTPDLASIPGWPEGATVEDSLGLSQDADPGAGPGGVSEELIVSATFDQAHAIADLDPVEAIHPLNAAELRALRTA